MLGAVGIYHTRYEHTYRHRVWLLRTLCSEQLPLNLRAKLHECQTNKQQTHVHILSTLTR